MGRVAIKLHQNLGVEVNIELGLLPQHLKDVVSLNNVFVSWLLVIHVDELIVLEVNGSHLSNIAISLSFQILDILCTTISKFV